MKKEKKRKKLNTDEGIIGANGIKIDGDIKFSYDKELNRNYFSLVQFLLAAFSLICTMKMTEAFLDEPNVAASAIVLSMILLVAYAFIFVSKRFKIIGIAYVIMHAFSLIPRAESIQKGFYVVIYWYAEKSDQMNTMFGAGLNDISHNDYSYYASEFMIFLASIIVTFIAISTLFKMDFPLLFVTTFPIMELGLYWGWEAPLWTIAGLIVCWVTVLAVHIINHSTNKAGKGNTFAVHRRKNSYFFTSEEIKNRFFTVYAKGVALLCACIILTSVIFSSVTGFVRPDSFYQLRIDISKAVDDFSYNSIVNIIDDYEGGVNLFSVKAVGGTNGGVLGKSEGISFSGATALEVRAVKPYYTMYLRGYVAGQYTGDRWVEIDGVSENDPAVEAFRSYGCYPQDYNYLINQYHRNLIDGGVGTDEIITIGVEGASKRFVYAPYMTFYSSDDSSGDDRMVPEPESYVSLRDRTYSLTYTDMSDFGSSWNEIINNLYHQSRVYSDYSREYSDFVNENYLDINKSAALDEVYEVIKRDYLESMNSYYSISDGPVPVIEAVSQYFSDNYVYTLSPGKTPRGEDFIDYFLTEQKEGYCSYYASAGVMLMRRFGYPARYVEGYVIETSQFEAQENNRLSKVTVTDRSAHAWCEIYLNNIGWVPCEFTPGYDNDNPHLTDNERNPDRQVTTTPQQTTTTANSEISSSTTSQTTTTTKKSANEDESSTSSNDSESSQEDESSGDSSDSSTSENEGAGGFGIGTGGGSGSSSGGKKVSDAVLSYLLYFGGILLIIFAVVIKRQISLSTMRKRIDSSDNGEAVKAIYRYYIKYLSLLAVTKDRNITDLQSIEEIIAQCSEKHIDIPEDDLRFVTSAAVEAFMSCNEISNEKTKDCRSALSRIADEVVYDKLSPLGKFSAAWIYNLY